MRPQALRLPVALAALVALVACGPASSVPTKDLPRATGALPSTALHFRGSAIAFDDKDDARFALGEPDGSIELHDGAVNTIRAHTKKIDALAFCGDLLASAGGEVAVWDTASRTKRGAIAIDARALAFSPSGRFLAAATSEGTRVHDAKTLALRAVFWGDHGPTTLAWRDDDRTLAVGDVLGGVSLFDAQTGSRLAALEGNQGSVKPVNWDEVEHGKHPLVGNVGPVTRVDWGEDGMTVLTATADGGVKLWDVARRALSRDVRVATGKTHATAALCGHRLVSADEAEAAREGDLDGATSTPLPFRATALVRTRTGIVAGIDGENAISILQGAPCAGDRGPLAALAWPNEQPGGDHERGRINALAWSADSRLVAVTTMDPLDTVRVFDVALREQILTVTRNEGLYDWDLAFAPDGHSLAVTTRGGDVLRLDLATSHVLWRKNDGGKGDAAGVAFDVEGKGIASSATANGIVDRGVNLWPFGEGAPTRLATCRARDVVWNRQIAVKCFDQATVEVWNPTTRAMVRRITTKGTIAWSPSGQLVATCAAEKRRIASKRGKPREQTVSLCRIEDAQTGAVKRSVDLETEIDPKAMIAFDERAERLAVSSRRGFEVWDLASKKPLPATASGAVSGIKQMAFSPDGHHLATASRDKAVRIWDEGALVARLGGDF